MLAAIYQYNGLAQTSKFTIPYISLWSCKLLPNMGFAGLQNVPKLATRGPSETFQLPNPCIHSNIWSLILNILPSVCSDSAGWSTGTSGSFSYFRSGNHLHDYVNVCTKQPWTIVYKQTIALVSCCLALAVRGCGFPLTPNTPNYSFFPPSTSMKIQHDEMEMFAQYWNHNVCQGSKHPWPKTYHRKSFIVYWSSTPCSTETCLAGYTRAGFLGFLLGALAVVCMRLRASSLLFCRRVVSPIITYT